MHCSLPRTCLVPASEEVLTPRASAMPGQLLTAGLPATGKYLISIWVWLILPLKIVQRLTLLKTSFEGTYKSHTLFHLRAELYVFTAVYTNDII